MNKCLSFLAVLMTAVALGAAEKREAAKVEPRLYYPQIARRVATMMPRHHVLQKPMDDEISQKAWTNLVTYYDFDHSVFLKSDLDEFARRERSLDDEIRAGDVSFGYDVYRLYVERLKERIDFATNLLETATFDFTTNETYRIQRKDAAWPETRAEAERHWYLRMKNELLATELVRELEAEEAAEKKARKAAESASAPETEEETKTKPEPEAETEAETEAGTTAASETAPGESAAPAADEETPAKDTPAESLVKKYRQYYAVLSEPDEEAVLQNYLCAFTHAYDPHSDYLSPASKEDFDMDMNLTLCGVGAVLQMDDGALKITEVMPGGPIDRDGRIHEGDKIVGVRQGDGEMEDVTWQPMKKSIKKIRGKKGTRVTLEIIPRSDPTGATRKHVELVRDEIKLEDQAATGRVEVVVSPQGVTNRLGYVYLPGFYGTMDKRPNEPGYRSAALDVSRYLADFNAAGVDGLVLDLRGDGGGSLREAVLLSALFVPSGPVVQIRDGRNVAPLQIPPGNPVAFRRPMVVLTDRASASASEIVAGHLRDVGRAVVLGDGRTHGKGTVQTVMGMGPERYGSMKITTARFYRVNGRSTQVKGVEADVRLPSLLDSLDVGEDKLPNALPFTRIAPADYGKCWDLDEAVPELQRLSDARLGGNERYAHHLESVAGMKAIADRVDVPLEREARKAMMKADRALRELDESEDEDAEEVEARRRKRNQRPDDDPVLDEALRVLADLIRLRGGREMPRKTDVGDWANALFEF